MTAFIADIKKRLPQADWPVVVAALRNNAQIWAELQGALGAAALDAAAGERSRWAPAFLGLLQLGHADQFDLLRADPMQPVSEKLRYQAAAAYEQLAADPAAASAPDLRQAALLALALRERRRLLNSWEQLPHDLSIVPADYWRLPAACLLGITPRPHDLLETLLAPSQAALHPIGLHALVANPYPLDVQAAHLLEIIQEYPLTQLIDLLRALAPHAPGLAQQAAEFMLDDLVAAGERSDDLSEIQRLLLQAEVYQIGGQAERATPLLQAAWEASQQLQMDLATKVAEANGEDAEILAFVQVSAQMADPKMLAAAKQVSRRPAALLSAAKVSLKSGEEDEAKEMALAALQAAGKKGSTAEDIEKVRLLHELGEFFIGMDLRLEAESAAKAALELQGNDAQNAALLSKLLFENGDPAEGLAHAQLASALAPEDSAIRRLLAEALQEDAPEDALIEWKAALEHADQPAFEDWLALAAVALAAGQPAETLAASQQALALRPGSGRALALMGRALLTEGDEDSAAEYLQRATELSPTQLDAWVALVELQQAKGGHEAALASLTTALQYCPVTAGLQAKLAGIHLALGQQQSALQALQLAAQLAQDEAEGELAQEIALQLAELYLQLDQPEEARLCLQAAHNVFPENAHIARQLGRLWLQAGEHQLALSALSLAQEAYPQDAQLLLDLARAQLALDSQIPAAESSLRAALALPDAPAEAAGLLAEALAAQGRQTEAIAQYDAAQQTELGKQADWRKRLLLGKAQTEMKQGDAKAAIDTLEILDIHEPGDLQVLQALCAANQLAGRPEQAALLAQKVYLGQPEDEETILWFAEQMDALGKSAEACRALSKQVVAGSPSPRLAFGLGKLQWNGATQAIALSTFKSILDNGDSQALSQTAEFLRQNGQAKESIAYYQKALKLEPLNADWLFGLSQAYSQAEQPGKALGAVEKALDIAPAKPALLSAKAEVLLQLDRPQAALEALSAALELRPSDASLLHAKAQLLRQQADWFGALQAAEAALQHHPGQAEYIQNAAELAALNLYNQRAAEILANTNLNESADLLYLQAELHLSAGMEVAATEQLAILHTLVPPDGARLLALQVRLAAARGDLSTARAEFGQAGQPIRTPDVFGLLGLAAAAESLNDWDTSIDLHNRLVKEHPGLPAAQFGLGRALVCQAEWQQLCRAAGATRGLAAATLNDETYGAASKAFQAAGLANNDPRMQTYLAGWSQRAALRFGQAVDLQGLPAEYPANAGEAAALLFALGEQSHQAQYLLESHWDTPEVLLQRALSPDSGDSYGLLQAAASQMPRVAPAQALAAQQAFQAGETERALHYIQAALSLWPEQPAWQALAGKLQHSQGRLAEASQHFQLAAELEPEQAEYFFSLGLAQSEARLLPAAIDNLEKAVELAPDQASYLLTLAQAKRQSGDAAAAKSLAERAQQAAPQDPAALILQAQLTLESDDAPRAKNIIQKALELAPRDADALRIFGETLYALGQSSDAVAVLERAAQHAADEVPLLLRRAQLLAQPEGLQALKQLAQKHASRVEVQFALSQMLALMGDLPAAIQSAQSALKAAASSASNLSASIEFHLGQLLKQAGNLDQALHHLDEAARLAPQLFNAHMERARVFLARRQHTAALKAFEQASKAAPQAAAPHYEAALALKDAKDYPAAEEALRQAANLAPRDRDIQRQLAAVMAMNLVQQPQTIGAG
ncbi:MAG: tetratricopeptide repeat protein [Anaerolineales bacterium]|nr:tetratricopeptide repeat protein [Anaerolineales bacterium]